MTTRRRGWRRATAWVTTPCWLRAAWRMQASACGDSLFRAGFGLNIPVVKVEQAARIVIFTPSNHDVFFDDKKVAARLDKSGHKVTVVHEATEPVATSDTSAFDIVLARDSDFETARQAMGPQVANSVFVPINPPSPAPAVRQRAAAADPEGTEARDGSRAGAADGLSCIEANRTAGGWFRWSAPQV